MTTDQAASAALAIRDGQQEWTDNQLAAFKQLGMEGAPAADLAVFLHRCQVTRLDPFAGQICMVKRGSKWTIQTEIDGYRVIAQRAAKRDGVVLSYGPTYWFNAAGEKSELWLGDGDPAGAAVTVYKDGKPHPGQVRFASFVQRDRDGHVTRQWKTMPDHMIAKCAEAQALRKAFPHDLEGIQTAEEAAYAEPQITVTQVTPPAPERRREPRPDSVTALRQAIRAEFDRIGLEDHEERGIYVNRLANKPADAPLTDLEEGDLQFALDSLKECEDLAALVDLCAVEAS
jgi:phage recombination protein Bet